MKLKRYWFDIVCFVIILVFTTYVLLDIFLISRVDKKVSDSDIHFTGNTEGIAKTLPSVYYGNYEVMDSYSSDDVNLIIRKYREYDSDIYVAEFTLSNASNILTAFAMDSYGKNIKEKTSVIADRHNALFSINGDFYGSQENGYIIRNGVLYRSSSNGEQEDLVIAEDGSFKIINESDITAQEVKDDNAWQVFSFGPGLIIDNEISVDSSDEVNITFYKSHDNPRTAIGIIDNLHYVCVVVDGRTGQSKGVSLYQLASFMKNLGCTQAYNLDGGGSSTMYFQGEIINNPTDSGTREHERRVSDIVYIKE